MGCWSVSLQLNILKQWIAEANFKNLFLWSFTRTDCPAHILNVLYVIVTTPAMNQNLLFSPSSNFIQLIQLANECPLFCWHYQKIRYSGRDSFYNKSALQRGIFSVRRILELFIKCIRWIFVFVQTGRLLHWLAMLPTKDDHPTTIWILTLFIWISVVTVIVSSSN